MGSILNRFAPIQTGLWIVILLMSTSCGQNQADEPPRAAQIHQSWELQPGDEIGNYRVVAGLGDITIDLDGNSIYAPFEGRVQPSTQEDCVIFSSAEVPAYLFRLCGIRRPKLGQLQEGQVIGSGEYLHFAALRRQPNGKWAIVEPSSQILERTLSQ
ncbi:MAG: hypothetical protein F6K19_00685 [Cyanothece sp. SIO1E1]|nr:hypothetical protein [Cyanothece sp. SIO1E1]